MEQEITACQEAIQNNHGCSTVFEKTAPIKKTFQGKTIWEGEVHSFKITHPSGAARCFAWTEPTPGGTKITTVLAIAPVTTAHKAVQAALVTKIRGNTP